MSAKPSGQAARVAADQRSIQKGHRPQFGGKTPMKRADEALGPA